MNEKFLTAPWQEIILPVIGAEFTFWLLRYSLFVGAGLALVYLVLKRFAPGLRIQPRQPSADQLRRELGWSIATMGVFACMAWFVLVLKRNDLTQVYSSISDYGWGYYALSWALLLLIHDFYFYWAHRFMHWKPVYRRVHSVHHRSTNPSPLAAFAFHPLEAMIEYGWFIPLLMVMPMHVSLLALYPSLMLILNVHAHLGYELLPRGFAASRIGKYLLTATLHNQHHKRFHYNYGLWFFWWDRLFDTIDPGYEAEFRRDTSAAAKPQEAARIQKADPNAASTRRVERQRSGGAAALLH